MCLKSRAFDRYTYSVHELAIYVNLLVKRGTIANPHWLRASITLEMFQLELRNVVRLATIVNTIGNPR